MERRLLLSLFLPTCAGSRIPGHSRKDATNGNNLAFEGSTDYRTVNTMDPLRNVRKTSHSLTVAILAQAGKCKLYQEAGDTGAVNYEISTSCSIKVPNLGLRCCNGDLTQCKSYSYKNDGEACHSDEMEATFTEAKAYCEGQGVSLCPMEIVKTRGSQGVVGCVDTGCGYNWKLVWAAAEDCDADIFMDCTCGSEFCGFPNKCSDGTCAEECGSGFCASTERCYDSICLALCSNEILQKEEICYCDDENPCTILKKKICYKSARLTRKTIPLFCTPLLSGGSSQPFPSSQPSPSSQPFQHPLPLLRLHLGRLLVFLVPHSPLPFSARLLKIPKRDEK